ncbi:hypothetical protein [Alteromonas halophila]|uniref:Uncharacterized protein n=1 Tax=Alteromonas halophila TaxID=516698 RepID=A0A918JP01_9ALTE|nr:hypothetical protein [Alteromonas halophila]GGW89247.1 hypothetical protein GCM10007391_24330 [Alteromonas halophila]
MIAKQFLLCSVDIKEKGVWAELVNSSESMEEKDVATQEWHLRKQQNVNFCKHVVKEEMQYRDALEKSRNLDLLWNENVETCVDLNKSFAGFDIVKRETSLVVDYHGNFLFVICYTISYQDLSVKELAKEIFKNREITTNLGDSEWLYAFQDLVKEEVCKYVHAITKQTKLHSDNVILNNDAAFPLLFADSVQDEDLSELFRNEESSEQLAKGNALSADFTNSFFHVGWNYTLAVNFPYDVQENVFALMTKMQMSYYKFRYYKEYFNEVFTDILKNSEAIDSQRVDFFDKLKLNYKVFLANYFKFKYGLYPKYCQVMEGVERLWNIDKDTELLEKTFEAQSEFVNKKYSEANQRLNDKQNQALNIIALLQVAAFVSVIYDSLAFEEKWPNEFYTVLSLISISVIAVISLYVSFGLIRKSRKK